MPRLLSSGASPWISHVYVRLLLASPELILSSGASRCISRLCFGVSSHHLTSLPSQNPPAASTFRVRRHPNTVAVIFFPFLSSCPPGLLLSDALWSPPSWSTAHPSVPGRAHLLKAAEDSRHPRWVPALLSFAWLSGWRSHFSAGTSLLKNLLQFDFLLQSSLLSLSCHSHQS